MSRYQQEMIAIQNGFRARGYRNADASLSFNGNGRVVAALYLFGVGRSNCEIEFFQGADDAIGWLRDLLAVTPSIGRAADYDPWFDMAQLSERAA